MSDELEPRAIREYRVWCETGDPVGSANVTYGYVTGMHWVTPDPFKMGESTKEVDFQTESGAFDYARGLAERYMSEAVADATERFGEVPSGVLSEHGYHIQVCEGDNDVTATAML